MKYILCLAAICLLISQKCYTQVLLVTAVDHPDVHVFPDDEHQHEVHISINKTNPLNLLASANGNLHQSYFYTLDGGSTWSGAAALPNNPHQFCDPSTSFDASGRGYVSTLSIPSSNNLTPDGYLVQYTDDGGINLSQPQHGIGPNSSFADKEMITSVDDMFASPFANTFYCAWTDFDSNARVRTNYSNDGASTFGAATIFANRGMGANIQTGPEGQVYICWASLPLPSQQINFARSIDGGQTYTESIAFLQDGIRTTNQGNPNFGNTRVNDFPTMAVDKSCGQFRGRIYITYPEFRLSGSNQSVIRVRYSDDQGNTWSAPTMISPPDFKQSWFPAIAVDDLTGIVSVAFYSFDKIASDDQTVSDVRTNTYVSWASDGVTWQTLRVSDLPHITSVIPGFAKGYAGDYIGNASFGAAAHIAWMDDRTGTWQIYTSLVRFNNALQLSSTITDLYLDNPSYSGGKVFQTTQGIYVSSNSQSVQMQGSASILACKAGTEVVLADGFTTDPDLLEFVAEITNSEPCTTPGQRGDRIASPAEAVSMQEKVARSTLGTGSVAIYPCPAENYLSVVLNNTAVGAHVYLSVVGVTGSRYCRETIVCNLQQNRKVLNISHLSAGTYYLSASDDLGNGVTIKFIKL
jgi:hypothetical protein